MTSQNDEGDGRGYCVLLNAEQEYSLWLAGTEVPPGWSQVGPTGSKDECVAYVERVWTDMRPLSQRRM